MKTLIIKGMLIGLLTCCAGIALAVAGYDVPWWTIDSGGGTSSGGGYTVSGTIGQPDAGAPATGASYSVTGGFWAGESYSYQPDLQVRNFGDDAYDGNGLYVAEVQVKAQTIEGDDEAVYQFLVENDGTGIDSFTLVGATAPENWTVTYYQGENDITDDVTTGGLSILNVAPGETRAFSVAVQPAPGVSGGATCSLQIQVTSQQDAQAYDVMVLNTTKQAISDVMLTATPATSCQINTPITLEASTIGGGVVEYKFFSVFGGATTVLQGYGAANTCPFTPTQAGAYTFIVWAREVGNPAPRNDYATLSYTVTAPPLSGVTLTGNPQPLNILANRTITLTATPVNGINVEYRFFKVCNGVTTTIQPYTAGAKTLQVTPAELGQYQYIVWAREAGSATKYSASLTYKVNSALSAVTLTASPAWPAAPGTTVTLTAGQVNGGQVEYRFYVAEPGGALTIVQPYSTTKTCSFTVTQQGTYQFLVYAREVGSNVTKQAHAAATYNCATPITSANLVANPGSPVTVGTPINLTASTVGGYSVQYRFFVITPAGQTITLQDYTVGDNLCAYTPATAGRYTFIVWVRETRSTQSKDAYKAITMTVNPAP